MDILLNDIWKCEFNFHFYRSVLTNFDIGVVSLINSDVHVYCYEYEELHKNFDYTRASQGFRKLNNTRTNVCMESTAASFKITQYLINCNLSLSQIWPRYFSTVTKHKQKV